MRDLVISLKESNKDFNAVNLIPFLFTSMQHQSVYEKPTLRYFDHSGVDLSDDL